VGNLPAGFLYSRSHTFLRVTREHLMLASTLGHLPRFRRSKANARRMRQGAGLNARTIGRTE
jgi:hypothetical protein